MCDQKHHKSPEDLLNANRDWAAARLGEDAEFFKRLRDVQTPNYLWIGCSDSRVPANQIVGLQPGEVFVHRNIANQVPLSDVNCLSVVQFAVEALGVEHIIVTGHYGCGGVKAAMDKQPHGLLDNWLAQIKDVYHANFEELRLIKDERQQQDRLCELNVVQQVRNVARLSVVQIAWAQGKKLALHGWIYSLRDGILRDLGVGLEGPADLHSVFKLTEAP
ncbi:carbonic anhydrase [Magnetospira sp. QH-2]|uniref:carbonic anhydrase n=1 Tax=Magnetospira sp. (strain QH-2) TaxID=1288970 RepID=UPI0003E81A6B|nr:carbonic anhydrase [Magnetospira sp. QH-2]CCQ72448.1 Carbonic anhydrase [Magnetospira sp. QH-2]